MTETLLFFVAVLAASIVVMWCERNRLERQIASLQEELATERSTVSRQMIELAEVKSDKILAGESCLQVAKERDQIKTDYDYVRNALWEACETSSELRHSRTIITDHCRKLKRAIGHDRFAHKIEIDCARDMVDNMKAERDRAKKDFENELECFWEEYATSSMLRHSRAIIIDHCRLLKRELANEKRAAEHLSSECYTLTKQCDAAIAERDHARKLMDESRERCGAEIDVLESTIRDLGNYKTLAENRAKQIISENEYWCTVNDNLRQSRQKIIDHCRMLKRKQKKLIEFYDYVLEELTAIHTYR